MSVLKSAGWTWWHNMISWVLLRHLLINMCHTTIINLLIHSADYSQHGDALWRQFCLVWSCLTLTGVRGERFKHPWLCLLGSTKCFHDGIYFIFSFSHQLWSVLHWDMIIDGYILSCTLKKHQMMHVWSSWSMYDNTPVIMTLYTD